MSILFVLEIIHRNMILKTSLPTFSISISHVAILPNYSTPYPPLGKVNMDRVEVDSNKYDSTGKKQSLSIHLSTPNIFWLQFESG